jgi:hypothetical protein
MEYLLSAMFSDMPRRRSHPGSGAVTPYNTPRTGSSGGCCCGSNGCNGCSAAPAGGGQAAPVVTCVPEKRALHVEVVLKRLRMPAQALAAAIDCLDAERLKV